MRISVVGSSSSFETIVVFKESIAGYLSFIYSSKHCFGINQWEWRVSTSDFFSFDHHRELTTKSK